MQAVAAPCGGGDPQIARAILLNPDRLVKNYYIHRDPVTGEWEMIKRPIYSIID